MYLSARWGLTKTTTTYELWVVLTVTVRATASVVVLAQVFWT